MSGIGSGVSAGPAARFCVLLGDHSASQRPVLPSLGLQYDLSTSTFSPDGRVFQTDYAQKAVDNSGCGRRQGGGGGAGAAAGSCLMLCR